MDYSLAIPYDCFLNIRSNIHSNLMIIENAFRKFESDVAAMITKQGKLNLCVYGGGESGCLAFRYLEKIECINIVAVIDRFLPSDCFKGIPHCTPDKISQIDFDLIFISTSPRHYQMIKEQIVGMKPETNFATLFSQDDDCINILPEHSKLDEEYKKLYERCKQYDLPPIFDSLYSSYSQGGWTAAANFLFNQIQIAFSEKTVVDFGCGTGINIPMIKDRGASKVIGIEREQRINEITPLFRGMYDDIEFILHDRGYLPLQPESVDIVLMNEVISHINPKLLDVVISEVHRILKFGGAFVISDNNNLDNNLIKDTIHFETYEKYEFGEDGYPGKSGPLQFQEGSNINKRAELVRSHRPDLDESDVAFIAMNTYRVYGDYLIDVIKSFTDREHFIRRPFQKHLCPIEPENETVHERGFHPEMLKLYLNEFGFQCSMPFDSKELSKQNLFIITAIKAHA